MQARVTDTETSVPRTNFRDDSSTRYLCAGTYLDAPFRDWVLKNVYADTGRRVAPSYGFDVVPVLMHARNAWLFDAAQNTCLTALLAIAAWCAAPSMALLVTCAYLWFLAMNVRGYLRQRIRRFLRTPHSRDAGLYQESMHLAEERRRLRETLTIALVLAGFTVALTAWLQWGVWRVLLGTAPILLLAGLVYAVAELGRFHALRALGHRVGPVTRNKRLATIDDQQRSPVVAYAEDPFIGSGQVVHSWAFTQHLLRPRADEDGPKGSEFSQPPFRTRELVAHIRADLLRLAQDRGEETQIPGLEVDDLLLVEGRHLGRYERLLAHRPVLAQFEEFMADSRAPGRHHLACRVISWGGEIVTTVYLHTSLQGGLLTLKYTIHALTPTLPAFQMIDAVGRTDAMAASRAALRKLVCAPRALLAPLDFCKALRDARKVLGSPKDRTTGARHNIGAMVSAREHLTTPRDGTYFQELDVAKHSKIIERRIISSVGGFLKGKVLTDEYVERTNYILNNGVLNMGSGDITMGDGNTVGGIA
ncbi:hypothetical protein AB0J52_07910 [Spirillospora sp. NPDC049652]